MIATSVHLPRALLAQIRDQLQQAYPNEAGGFLLGRTGANGIVVVEVYPVENVFAAEEQYHRYAMTPQDWVRLEDAADARGLALVGYYHSHPDSPPVPSVYDREHALPNFVYIIIGVEQAQAVEARAWRLSTDRAAFDEQTLMLTDS